MERRTRKKVSSSHCGQLSADVRFGAWLCKIALPEVSRRRDLDEWRYGSFFSG